MVVGVEELVDRAADSGIEGRGALAARDHIPVRLLDPAGPGLRISLGDLFGLSAFPLAQVDLAQRCTGLGLEMNGARDELCCLEGSFQVARVQGLEAATGQSRAEQLRLTPAGFRERRVELTLDSVLLVPGRLAVADQKEARGGGTSRYRELRRLWARRSDLDAYTNFLLNPDRARQSQEKTVAIARHTCRNPPSIAIGIRSG